MSQQNLDDADVHASLKQVCGEAMAKRVRAELTIEPALASRFNKSIARGRIRQRSDNSLTGEQPTLAAMRPPDVSQHLQHRFRQRESALLVAFADDS